ncbi:hypothetical protein F5X96DRAFT_682913 [Biscogniauxia mediterranea]|nr:hypothetical protein F5X96DRAFT_682913 [Biscogniauxia mediterranea]
MVELPRHSPGFGIVEFTKRKPAHLYLEENKKHFRYKYEASRGHSSFIRTVMEHSCSSERAATTGAEPDLGPAAVIALLDTVSFCQAHFLRDFIYNHLVFNPLLRVSIPIGFKRFALEFHLPYFAWRKGSSCIRDERRMSDGRTLRRSQDLGFLDLTPSGTPSPQQDNYIYEAQMSCLVAGTGDASWVAYGIFDTYQNGTQDEESATYYHERACIPGQAPMDPLSGGKIMADCPVWDPRIYFLQVLESRIEQVKEEWINIVHRVQQKTCPYTQDHQVFKNLYLSPDTENRGERLKRFYEWTGSTTRLLMELIDVLSKTTHAWDHFQSREIEYFLDVNQHGDKPSPSPYLKAITKHIEEMKAQLLALQYQEKICSNILRELESYLQLEDRDSTLVQLRTNENVKIITIVTLLISPPTVAAAIFSMPDSVLPGEPSMLGWAVTTLIVYTFVAIGFLLNRLFSKGDPQQSKSETLSRSCRGWPWTRRRRCLPFSFSYPLRQRDRYDNLELSDLGSHTHAASFV